MSYLKQAWLLFVMVLLLVVAFPFAVLGYVGRILWDAAEFGFKEFPKAVSSLIERFNAIDLGRALERRINAVRAEAKATIDKASS